MEIKCLRIHMEEGEHKYDLYDRHGKFRKRITYPIRIVNPPPVIYFGFCPVDTYDVTLEFEYPMDSRKIENNSAS